jgi:Uma2 family endonuclease
MKVHPTLRVSEEEFLSWPESTNKIELIDGLVVRSPAPTWGHQAIAGRIFVRLDHWAEGRRVTIGHAPCDIRFAPNRILQPDVFVLSGTVPFRMQGPLDRVPGLCIEILSRNASHDRVTKRALYAEAGVEELWTVSLDGFVERWTGPGLADLETITRTLRTPLLEGFELDVASLFPQE